MSHNVIAINKFWGGLIGLLLVSFICGTFTQAKAIYDAVAEEKASRVLLETQVRPLIEAKLDTRMVSIEEKLKASVETNSRIENQQGKMSDKLDKILDRQKR